MWATCNVNTVECVKDERKDSSCKKGVCKVVVKEREGESGCMAAILGGRMRFRFGRFVMDRNRENVENSR